MLAMRVLRVGRLCILLTIFIACSQSAEISYDLSAKWKSETTHSGNVTTIRTLRGSIWRGKATLIEDLSIGNDDEGETYIFGAIKQILATQNHIFVLDPRSQALRMYNQDGDYIRDISRSGAGPGEFEDPIELVMHPVSHWMYLRDSSLSRVTVFSDEGVFQDVWSLINPVISPSFSVMTAKDVFFNQIKLDRPSLDQFWRYGLIGFDQDGATGDTLDIPDFGFEEPRLRAYGPGRVLRVSLPVVLYPKCVWTMSPSGAVIAGVSESYAFEVKYLDGSITRIEREADRVAVLPIEKSWHRSLKIEQMRRIVSGWNWNGPPLPDEKPYFKEFLTDLDGRIWVIRPAEGIPIEVYNRRQQTTSISWIEKSRIDVFEENGRYLGEVELPEGCILNQNFFIHFIRDDLLFARVDNEEGVQCVKRYRIQLPN